MSVSISCLSFIFIYLLRASRVNSIAIPASAQPQDIEERSSFSLTSEFNECMNPQNTEKNLRIQSCKPKKTLDKDGNCGPLDPQGGSGSYTGVSMLLCGQGQELIQGQSAAFCQVDVRWNYGPEVEFNDGCECSDPKCSITNTASVAVENSYAFSVGGNLKKRDLNDLEERGDEGFGSLKASDLLSVFNAGATWTYSTTYTNTTATQNVKPNIAANKCGYWTFVPYYVTTCGTLTYTLETYGPTAPITSPPTTIGGWCQTAPFTDSRGAPMGQTIFVARQCRSSTILPFCWQDPIYLDPGVSKNASVYEDYLAVHEDFDMTKPVESTPLIWCETNAHGYDEGMPLPGCEAGLPAGVKESAAYGLPS